MPFATFTLDAQLLKQLMVATTKILKMMMLNQMRITLSADIIVL